VEARTLVSQLITPVFLVGASRCGNTLVQESLSRHAHIHISSETHWFDDERCKRDESIDTALRRMEVQDWFLALSHQPFGHSGDPNKGWLKREVLEKEFQSGAEKDVTTNTRDNYFQAFCKLDAQQHGKERWGEKTPRHVFRINDMLAAFPNAKIVCSLRDPRAMVTSYRQWSVRKSHDLYTDQNDDDLVREKKRSRDSYHAGIAALLWRGAARSALKAIDDHGSESIRLVLYETLVSDPERTLRGITEWLEEPCDTAMLDVPLINSSFDDFKAGAGFNKHAIDRWKNQLSRSELAIIYLLCKREMARLGYQIDDQKVWSLCAIPQLITLPFAVYRAWRANRERTGNLISYIWRRLSA